MILQLAKLFRGSCPRCGESLDDDVCQTCGYPWN